MIRLTLKVALASSFLFVRVAAAAAAAHLAGNEKSRSVMLWRSFFGVEKDDLDCQHLEFIPEPKQQQQLER